jgi:hypothetical protein
MIVGDKKCIFITLVCGGESFFCDVSKVLCGLVHASPFVPLIKKLGGRKVFLLLPNLFFFTTEFIVLGIQ